MSEERPSDPVAPGSWGAWGARRAPEDRRSGAELAQQLRSIHGPPPGAGTEEPLAQLFDAGAIAGPAHLGSALDRSRRARGAGRARLTDPGAELLLYVAGSDQFPEALKRVGVQGDTREVVILFAPRLEEPLARSRIQALGLELDPGVYPRTATASTLARLGVPPEALRSVPPDRFELLAIEAGALVELPRGTSSRHKG